MLHVTNENLDCALVTLFVHNYCNYACSYCSPVHRSNSHRWPEDIGPFVDFLSNVRKQNKYTYMELLGGEPTIWPKFREFISTVSDQNTYIEFSTNASRSLRYWESFEGGPMYVMLSWHHEQCDDDHFVQVAKILQHKVSCGVAIMVTPENYDRAKLLTQRLEGLGIEILPRFVRKEIGSTVFLEYTREQRDWISNYRYLNMRPHDVSWELPINLHLDGKKIRFPQILHDGLHAFSGMSCLAGVRRFYVDVGGEIYRCSRRVGGSIGNIFNDYALPTQGIVCNQDLCPCKWDALTEKIKKLDISTGA